MAAELRAMAYDDPFYLGYLVGNTHYRGFPEYVRRFNAAFLALPALPSQRLNDACAAPEVVVRLIPTPAIDPAPTWRLRTLAGKQREACVLLCLSRVKWWMR
ncbi:MAG: hypothetical protein ACUVR7_13630 [Armatimonadota bacterium]